MSNRYFTLTDVTVVAPGFCGRGVSRDRFLVRGPAGRR